MYCEPQWLERNKNLGQSTDYIYIGAPLVDFRLDMN